MSCHTFLTRRYTAEMLAKYFHVPVAWILSALRDGAQTDRDIWNYIQDIQRERR